ncbi:hypothetical protein AC578_2038 [Pseudocercospora eumusae]|uniref:Kinesin motor domain-containing protein n=1 Tax=Pseudocercospora eumusae TaxID=321146 RepID=A0A139H8Z3_9PEZI|nr:hypothetical protein AC578_2038 [Pseudocercospora eumusae]
MERPQSQLENVRPSGLKPPSRLPALSGNIANASRTLQETSSSDLNARTATASGNGNGNGNGPAAAPTNAYAYGIVPSKHKVYGLPEPPAKRKTLAERAAEPVRSHIPSKSSISSGFGSRPKTNIDYYRNPANTAISSSTNGIRPNSRQANALPRYPAPRAVKSSLNLQAHAQHDDQESDGETSVMGRRDGTPVLSFNHNATSNGNSLHIRKTRTQSNLRQQNSVQSQSASARSQHLSTTVASEYRDGSGSSAQSSRQSSNSSSSSTSTAPAQQDTTQPGAPVGARNPSREVSISTAFAGLSLTPRLNSISRHRPSLESIKEEKSPSKIPKFACAPQASLRHTQSAQVLRTPSPLKQKPSMAGLRTPVSNTRHREVMPVFLTKEALTPVAAFDTNLRLDSMEKMFNSLKNEMAKVNHSKEAIETSLELYKTQAAELQAEKRDLASQCKSLSSDLERTRTELHTTSTDLRQVRRDHERELHDLERKHDKELSDLRLKQEREDGRVEREREREADRFRREMEEAQSAWEKEKDREISDMTTQHWDELDQIKTAHEKELSDLRAKVHELEEAGESRATESASEVQLLRDIVASTQSQLDASNATIASLRSRITTFEARISTLEQEKNSLVSKAHFLEGNQEAQSQEFTVMQQKLEEAIAAKEATVETLRKEEALRRKLNAMILELRGNIRVFVRTRPLLNGEDDPAKVEYLDQDSLEGCKEMIVHAPTTQTATGKQRNEKHQYDFDRVFTPGTSNPTVFEECRDLIQSVVDGYNVSILSYGQTGSGKTYGMTGPEGIIPSSIRMLLSEMGRLREKGWEYAVEANFVEVYNETLNDLLGDAKTWDDTDDVGASVRGKKKEKHEIHHDAATGKTTVTNLTTVGLWPPPNDDGNWPPPAPVDTDGELTVSYTEKAVTNLLDTAAKNRRVAATKANERSSRSHSIFMLTLKGSCPASGEHSEGVLNLVDLAGSERLKQSGAEGSRMKETQAINKSLSSLGDVIAALGTKSGNSEAHVPYRNSKLTYLLQSSLGGTTAGKSSRTLMLLHLSPLQAHWQESRSSLLFGSKVHGTHIGTAKKR